mmetsp:Transcript_20315/g.65358  ORF Transcript_20315/g.65358 Transcript_20315/m.65358 type:complete len:217 (+) Transcript_20315:951-1601(+)
MRTCVPSRWTSPPRALSSSRGARAGCGPPSSCRAASRTCSRRRGGCRTSAYAAASRGRCCTAARASAASRSWFGGAAARQRRRGAASATGAGAAARRVRRAPRCAAASPLRDSCSTTRRSCRGRTERWPPCRCPGQPTGGALPRGPCSCASAARWGGRSSTPARRGAARRLSSSEAQVAARCPPGPGPTHRERRLWRRSGCGRRRRGRRFGRASGS